MSEIKNIIFDLGGVILNLDYSKTVNEFKKLGVLNFQELYSQKKILIRCLFSWALKLSK